MKTVYQNRLPHIAPIGASFFVTFRLADSLPQHIIEEIQQALKQKEHLLRIEYPNTWNEHLQLERKRVFGKYEHQLDICKYGDCLLNNPKAANLIIDKIRTFDGQYYDLWAYCIMPNHVHLLLDFSRQIVDSQNFFLPEMPQEYKQLDYVMMRIKGASAYEINRAMSRTGKCWAKDSYDHFVRDEDEWYRIVNYIIRNPVKAKLVSDWEQYPYTFCRTI